MVNFEDTAKWGHVASYMNQHLHGEGVWQAADEYSFNGSDCLNFFTQHSKRLDSGRCPARYPELRDIVSETVTPCGAV